MIEFGYERPPHHVQELFDAHNDYNLQRAIFVRQIQKASTHFITMNIPEAIGRTFARNRHGKKDNFRTLLLDAGVRTKAGDQSASATSAEPTVASPLTVRL